MRTPTEKQYRTLRVLADGCAGLSMRKRQVEPLLRRGWVTADWVPPYYQWVRITADGLRALGAAVDKYGLPDIGPRQEPPPEPSHERKLREVREQRDEARRELTFVKHRLARAQRILAGEWG